MLFMFFYVLFLFRAPKHKNPLFLTRTEDIKRESSVVDKNLESKSSAEALKRIQNVDEAIKLFIKNLWDDQITKVIILIRCHFFISFQCRIWYILEYILAQCLTNAPVRIFIFLFLFCTMSI